MIWRITNRPSRRRKARWFLSAAVAARLVSTVIRFMPRRTVSIHKLETGELAAVLEQLGDVPEEIIESELLTVIYTADPALDETGRLVPGMKNSEISLSLHLPEPDAEGTSHLGGIRGSGPVFYLAVEELKKIGYEVVDGRV